MEELVDKIVEIEWSYFTNLKNTGGRASCQDNREEFFLTRKSQWESICSDIIDKLEEEEIIIRVSDYLGYYGPIIQSRIDNDEIRDLGFWSDK